MLKPDMDMYALTRDRPEGSIIQWIDDGVPPGEPIRDENGNVTLGGAIGYTIALALTGGTIAYLMLGI